MLSGGMRFLYNRGADVIGWYAIFVKTVLLVLVEGFTSIGFFDVFFLFRSSCLALDWEIDAGIERYWDCRFTLAIMRCCRWNWDLPFYLAFVIFVRDLSYLEPSRGAVCDTVFIDNDLRRSGVSCRGFPIMWRGILFLGDVTRLWAFLTSRGQSDKRYSWGT